ncbi:ABC-F family ATP-binding cassette domain-containing protein [Vagococcus fluvialis]|uniref:ABC-F family ATP-binding cassette domain-containing protein n=1 Tax=Vagococcus fluvialis TaxID=2738 RepID=UPI003B5B7CED
MELVNIQNLSYRFDENLLYGNSSFKIMSDDHMAITGLNGSGKSTLLKLLIGKLIPDTGDIIIHPNTTIGYIDQYISIDNDICIINYLKSSFLNLYQMEKEMISLYDDYSNTFNDLTLKQASILQEKLDLEEFYSIENKIEYTLIGLGLDKIPLNTKFKDLSLSQKMKTLLAKILLENPSILILDEPTNYLDSDNMEWLTTYLQNYKRAFVVVSHDNSFIEKIASCICDISSQEIKKYHTGYNQFLKLKHIHDKTQLKEYQNQQKHIKETQDFINKNIAGIKTKMAQGRRKQLEKMNKLSKPESNTPPIIHFKSRFGNLKSILSLENVSIGYNEPLIQNIHLNLGEKNKIVIYGNELSGKTALLKSILGDIPVIQGTIKRHPEESIGYFTQDLFWENPSNSSIDYLANLHSELSYEDIRQALSRCGIDKTLAERPIFSLSGGEQSKLKICNLTLKSFNLLIFDEPTKYLDKQSISSLKKAIRSFQGTVIVVSSDQQFRKDIADVTLKIVNRKLVKPI